MAKKNFQKALENVLRHEGGYTNHPADPGGPTNFGITIYDYRLYIKKTGTAADVKAMSIEQAKQIYKDKYWDVLRCDDLPSGLDYTLFDLGVNSGIGRAAEFIRRILGLQVSPKTIDDTIIAAINKSKTTDLVYAVNDMRMKFLKRLKTWPSFGRGWSRRVGEVKAISLQMVAHDV